LPNALVRRLEVAVSRLSPAAGWSCPAMKMGIARTPLALGLLNAASTERSWNVSRAPAVCADGELQRGAHNDSFFHSEGLAVRSGRSWVTC
jgi:hypothetical protein